MTPTNIRFQIVIDSDSILVSPTPDTKKMRLNIAGLDQTQIENIVDCIIDAGPEAVNYLKFLIDQKKS